jgi:hypothetical protein
MVVVGASGILVVATIVSVDPATRGLLATGSTCILIVGTAARRSTTAPPAVTNPRLTSARSTR